MRAIRESHLDLSSDSCRKLFFLKGYNEMLQRIEPKKIICYNEPFLEMQGDIVFVDYDRSSWKYMDEDTYIPSKYAKYICGEEPLPAGSDLIIKSGYVVNENDKNYNSIVQTGMGSAHGGTPHNEEEKRFYGEPGEIKLILNIIRIRMTMKWIGQKVYHR